MVYSEMSREELLELKKDAQSRYDAIKGQNLKLDMSRGKPNSDQLDLSMGMMDELSVDSDMSEGNTDTRNYGVVDGLTSAKKLMAGVLDSEPDEVIVCGNSSLNIMFDIVAQLFTHGVNGSKPWSKIENKIKFLCPVPGYDRHFAITEYFDVEMINIPMTADGPDMDMVERYVNGDSFVKGMWCVPKYSNPAGTTYSEKTVKRLAALTPAAEDFRIFWDNAYSVHHLYDEEENQDKLLDILAECKKTGHPDMVYKFASLSKVTFPGAGISAVSASKANLDSIRTRMKIQTIGHDKINQLRHVKFLGDMNGIKEHMKKQAAIIRPKFKAVLDILDDELSGTGVAEWTEPRGGYFISFDTLDGCARNVISKCAEAGVKLTGAGSSYPYHNDPTDSNIRIAPTYPTANELKSACEVLVVSTKLVCIDKILALK